MSMGLFSGKLPGKVQYLFNYSFSSISSLRIIAE